MADRLQNERDDTNRQILQAYREMDNEAQDMFMAFVSALPDSRPGCGGRMEQYYKWHGSLTKEQVAAIPHEDHKRILVATVLGEPFPEDLRQYWTEGCT